MTVATAVTDSQFQDHGLNAQLKFHFKFSETIENLWPALKKQVFQELDHHHIGKLHEFQEGEQGDWQVLSLVERCLTSHKELSDLLVSVRLNVSDQRSFERRYS